jgi:hypothetical protein
MDYNIHGIGLKINEHGKFSFKPIDMEFSHFSSNTKPKTNLIVNIGDFKSKNKNCFLVDNKYFVKDNYFFVDDENWKVEITGLEKNSTKVNFFGKKFLNMKYASLAVTDHIILPILQKKLAEKGYFFTHAAGVTKNNKGVLIVGHSHSFKTTITMCMIRKGYEFLGDDFILLKDKKIYSFPRFPSVFFYRTKFKSEEELNVIDKIKIRKDYKKFKPEIRDFSYLNMIVFLNRTSHNTFKIKKINETESNIKLYVSDDLENSYHKFYIYKLIYDYLFPKQNKKIKININKIQCYSTDFSKENINKLTDWIIRKNNG